MMLSLSEYLIAIILGLITGSFTNTIIYRIPRNQSILLPNSFCPQCTKPILFYDLIPIVSYINLRGKCRYCKKRIGLKYPLVELLMGVLFFVTYYQGGFSLKTISGMILAVFIVSAAFIDMEWEIIPDKITYPAIISGLALAFFSIGIKSALAGGLFFGGVLLLAAIISRDAMGGGDIKFAAAIGLYVGFEGAVIAFMIAVSMGGLYGLVLMILGRADRKTAIKFGPFLAVGAFISNIFGTQLVILYFGLW